MEVNAFDITVVNLCFGGAQRLKDRDCRPLCRLADRRTGNDLFDFSQAAAAMSRPALASNSLRSSA